MRTEAIEPLPLTPADFLALSALEEKGGDHFYGAWKGGKAKSGGGPDGGADGDPKTSKAEEKAAPSHAKALASARKGDHIEATVNGKKVSGTVHVATHDGGVVVHTKPSAPDKGRVHITKANSSAFRITSYDLGNRAAQRAANAANERVKVGPGRTMTKAAAQAAGWKPGPAGQWLHESDADADETVTLPPMTTPNSALLSTVEPEPLTEADVLALAAMMEKGAGDHFYGAWKGGKAKNGGGPDGGKDGDPKTSKAEEKAGGSKTATSIFGKTYADHPTLAQARAKGRLRPELIKDFPAEAKAARAMGLKKDPVTGRWYKAGGSAPAAPKLPKGFTGIEKRQYSPNRTGYYKSGMARPPKGGNPLADSNFRKAKEAIAEGRRDFRKTHLDEPYPEALREVAFSIEVDD